MSNEIERDGYELQDLGHPSKVDVLVGSSVLPVTSTIGEDGNAESALEPPEGRSSSRALQRWNTPRSNLWRTLAAFYSFLILGLAAAAYGALLPYIEAYYKVSYTIVALVFLMGFPGYICAAFSTHKIHQRFGQRGIAILGTTTHVITWIVISLHPPFPVVIVMFALQGFGHGIIDSAWNAWLADMTNAHEIMGFLHGFFGLGGVLAPLIATTLVTKANWPWYRFYWLMVAAAVIEALTAITAFWTSTGEHFRTLSHAPPPTAANGAKKASGPLREAVLTRQNGTVTWLCSLLLWVYIGAEISLSGWIVTFMLRERNGSQFASGMAATGFWLGLTVGRFVLGFVTPRIGDRLAIVIYLLLSTILEIIFWRVPNFAVSATAVSLQGFFLGPVFPSAIVVSTKLLPKHLHVTAVSFVSAVGSSGGSIWPFVVGAVAARSGVEALQPIVLALLLVMVGVWVALPRGGRKVE